MTSCPFFPPKSVSTAPSFHQKLYPPVEHTKTVFVIYLKRNPSIYDFV